MTAALIAIAIRDATKAPTPAPVLIASMKQDLRKAEQQAKSHPTNAGICPKCGRISKFCTGC